jgi:hypothetical protein
MYVYVHWRTQIISSSSTTVREVTCANCGTEYAYALSRTESGTGTSPYGLDDDGAKHRALKTASSKLDNSLDCAFELVPCPQCGDYQPEMVAFLKNSYRKWLYIPAALLFLVAVAALVRAVMLRGNGVLISIAIVCIAAGIYFVKWRWREAASHDPNQGDSTTRIEQGKRLALVKQEDHRRRPR